MAAQTIIFEFVDDAVLEWGFTVDYSTNDWIIKVRNGLQADILHLQRGDMIVMVNDLLGGVPCGWESTLQG